MNLPLGTLENVAGSKNKTSQPVLEGLGLSTPPQSYSQRDLLAFVLETFSLSPESKRLYKRFFSHPSIQTRHLAVDSLNEIGQSDLDALRRRFERRAPELGSQALQKALSASNRTIREIDLLIATSCTGYLCPGLSSYLLEISGANSSTRGLDLVGMGCGAAMPGLEQAHNFVLSHPGKAAAVVSVEMCSLAFLNDPAPDQIMSNALFSDGAAAAIIGTGQTGASLGRMAAFESVHLPEWRDLIRFRTQNGYLKNVLDKTIPEKSSKAIRKLIDSLLIKNNLRPADVHTWALHPGGEKIIHEIGNALNLSNQDLAPARSVLAQFGNMSSPSVLFVLAEAFQRGKPQPGHYGVLASFGSGFSATAALLEF